MKRELGIDSVVIGLLENMGSDLKREQEVEFFLYFPEEYQAFHVAAELVNLQFKVNVSYSKHGEKWLCFATKSMTATTERLVNLRGWMEKLAERHDGEYDGWGMGFSPEEN